MSKRINPPLLIPLQSPCNNLNPPNRPPLNLTYFPVQKECSLERKTEILLFFSSPCSNLLFVNAALTPEPLGVGGIPLASDHNTCSAWEAAHRSRPEIALTKVALLNCHNLRGSFTILSQEPRIEDCAAMPETKS